MHVYNSFKTSDSLPLCAGDPRHLPKLSYDPFENNVQCRP